MFIADEFCIIDSEVSQNNFQLELVYYIITLSFVSFQNVKQTYHLFRLLLNSINSPPDTKE